MQIPASADLRGDLSSLGPVEYAQLLRSNLVPRDNLPRGRESWNELWATIDQDPDLTERAFDVLEEFLDACDAAIADPASEQQRQRATKFRLFCDNAWQRLQNVPEAADPLGWAGRAARGFNPPARRVLAELTEAIAGHRDRIRAEGHTRPADEELWAVLRAVGLDPARARR